MKIIITRSNSSITGTPGLLHVIDTGFNCDTLELPWDNNNPQTSCIEADTYTAALYFSPHLNRDVILLEDKNGRTNCEIHCGNFAGNTSAGEYSQVLGCTEVGRGYGLIARPNGDGSQLGILNSVITLDALLANIGPGPHTVTYEWSPGSAPAAALTA